MCCSDSQMGPEMIFSASTLGLIATPWHSRNERTLEFGAETTAERHVVKIVLRTMNIRSSVCGRTVQDMSLHWAACTSGEVILAGIVERATTMGIVFDIW